jgi:hypothetical protein
MNAWLLLSDAVPQSRHCYLWLSLLGSSSAAIDSKIPKLEGTKLANTLKWAKSNSWPFPDLKEQQRIHSPQKIRARNKTGAKKVCWFNALDKLKGL